MTTHKAIEELEIGGHTDIDSTKSIGASRIANACGFGYLTPLQQYLEMRNELAPSPKNKRMVLGVLHEDAILKTYELVTGIKLHSFQKLFTDKERRIHCHIDAMTRNAPSKVVDAKYSSEFMLTRRYADGSPVWGPYGSDIFPTQYHFQLNLQMMLTGCTQADLAVQFGNANYQIYQTEFNLIIQKAILKGAKDFWNCMDTNQPPPFENIEDVRLLYQDELNKETAYLGEVAFDAVRKKQQAETAIRKLQAEIDEAKQVIETEIAGAEIGLLPDGSRIKRSKTQKGLTRVYYPRT